MLRKGKEKVFAFVISLDRKPPYPVESAMKSYPIGYVGAYPRRRCKGKHIEGNRI